MISGIVRREDGNYKERMNGVNKKLGNYAEKEVLFYQLWEY